MAVKESNFKLPSAICRFGRIVLVDSPFSVGVNGGDVSFGGQHNTLRSISLDSFVTVTFSPTKSFAVVALLITILLVLIVVIVVGLSGSELSNWDPRTRYVAELSNAAVPETGMVVFPAFVSVVTIKH